MEPSHQKIHHRILSAFFLALLNIQIDNHYLKANSTYPGLIIRYNQQGENPTANSPELIDQLDINDISEIRLAVFSPSGERSSRVEIVKNLLDANLN